MARKLWIATLLCVAIGALTALGLTEGSRVVVTRKHRPLGLKPPVAEAPATPNATLTVDVPFPNFATPASLTVDGSSVSTRMEPAAIVVAVESNDETRPSAIPATPPLDAPALDAKRLDVSDPPAPLPAAPPAETAAAVAADEPAPQPGAPVDLVLDEITRVRQAIGAVVADLTESPPAAQGAETKDAAAKDATSHAGQAKSSNQFADALARLAAQPEPPAEWVDLDAVEPRQPITERARETLRRTSRELEQLAADLEDSSHFEDADRIRNIIQYLRLEARRTQGVPTHATPNY